MKTDMSANSVVPAKRAGAAIRVKFYTGVDNISVRQGATAVLGTVYGQ